MKHLNIRLLECLIALIRYENVTVAAERLQMSQGNMSNSLARLRKIFGDPILVRTTRGMTITERALELYPRVQIILAELKKLSGGTATHEISSIRQILRVACADVTALMIIGPILRELTITAPGVQLEVVQVPNLQIQGQLASGAIDLSIGFYSNPPPTLHTSHLYSCRMVGVSSPYADLSRAPVSLEQYCSAAHGVLLVGTGFRTTMETATDEALAMLKQQRSVRLASQYATQLMAAVATTNLIITFPDFVIQAFISQTPLKTFELPFEVPAFQLSMLWHDRLQENPALQWLRKTIRQHTSSFLES